MWGVYNACEWRNVYPVHVFALYAYVHECVHMYVHGYLCVFWGEFHSFLRIN